MPTGTFDDIIRQVLMGGKQDIPQPQRPTMYQQLKAIETLMEMAEKKRLQEYFDLWKSDEMKDWEVVPDRETVIPMGEPIDGQLI